MITNFQSKKIQKEKAPLSIIKLDSVIKANKKYQKNVNMDKKR